MDKQPSRIQAVTPESWQQLVTDESRAKGVVAYFFADWCGPCRDFRKKLDEFISKYAGPLAFCSYDLEISQNTRAIAGLDVTSIPALRLFHHGRYTNEVLIGNAPKEKLVEFLGRCERYVADVRPVPAN